jgi:ketosteroid isomerase-like protein
MNGRILLFSLVVALVGSAQAAKYERTLDGKTKIVRFPNQGKLEASWSGNTDENGLATGGGTLTWFRVQRRWETGSLLPANKYIQVSQYTGKMVEGKLEGSVAFVNASGKEYHAKFADGRKSSDWISGPVTSKKRSEDVEQPTKVAETPAEGPRPTPKLDQHVAEKVPSPAPAPKQQTEALVETSSPAPERHDDSLRSLAMPPSSLRVASLNERPAQPAAPDQAQSDSPVSSAQTGSTPADIPASPTVTINDDTARAIAALDSEYHTAVKTNDAATIDRILADDFVLSRSGGISLSKTDLVNRARANQARYERHEVEDGSQKVRVWHDTAVVTETVWVKGTEDGKQVNEKMSVTSTYAHTPNGWRYVAGQASALSK